jgi:hypothetical protein
MDARAGLIALALTGCGAAAPPCARVLARGTLAYDATALATRDEVVAIELETRFALVVHDAATGAIRGAVDLGGPERDVDVLAIDPRGATAFVGGRDQAVRAIALDRLAVTATWPVGADVTALAATSSWVIVGDATGAVCLRRMSDGALLQCLAAADRRIDDLRLDGADVIVTAGSLAQRYTLPALAAVGRPRVSWTPPFAPPVRLGGAIRAVRATPRGTVVSAWVHTLDDPSIVLIPQACPR